MTANDMQRAVQMLQAIILVAGSAVIFSMTGCTSQVQVVDAANSTRPLPPDPHPAPATPADVKPTRMVFAVGSKPDDTDGNGFPDQIAATVMLFAPPYPSPMFVDGTFEIVLYHSGAANVPNATPIAQWTISGEAVEQAKFKTTIGPQYRFVISLLDSGSDRFSLALADLTCRFIPADGSEPVTSDGVRSIQIGKTATAGR